tara:strand:- start:714 stop:980 length:267 start_codon:yes stop_codon:yes gene_type:complete
MKDKDRIKQLEEQLEEARKHSKTYVYETDSLWCNDGELHMQYNDNSLIVFNVETLFRDLPYIVQMIVKENKKMQNMYSVNLKEILSEL